MGSLLGSRWRQLSAGENRRLAFKSKRERNLSNLKSSNYMHINVDLWIVSVTSYSLNLCQVPKTQTKIAVHFFSLHLATLVNVSV